MQQICGVTLYSPRGQCILMLLAACREIGGSPRKSDCLDFIANRSWFKRDIGQDLKPYPGSVSKEARWKTLFAWARNDAADHDCIIRGEEGFWPISKRGKEELGRQFSFIQSKDLPIRLLFLATPAFKKFIIPGYEPTAEDLPRPASIYEDDGRYVHHNIQRMFVLHGL